MELNRLFKELLATKKKTAQETLLWSVLRNEGNRWSEFYKYVKRRKVNTETLPAIKDHNGTITTDSTERAYILNSYNESVFCCDRNILEIQLAASGVTFIVNTKIVRLGLAKIVRKNWVRPDGSSW